MKEFYSIIILFFLVCLPTHAASVAVTIKDMKGKPLSNTVVYLEAGASATSTQGTEIQVEQRGKEFHPFVSVTTVGTTAFFPNQDGIGHHVYSFSPAKTFELPLSESKLTSSIVFDKAGIITVGCNIHDWMVGYIYVVDTPYHAVTNETGQVTINNLPAGNYTIHVWHPGIKAGAALEQALVISETELAQQDFSLDIRPEYFWKPTRPPEIEEEEY